MWVQSKHDYVLTACFRWCIAKILRQGLIALWEWDHKVSKQSSSFIHYLHYMHYYWDKLKFN